MTSTSPSSSDLSSTTVGVSAMLMGVVTAAMTMRLGTRLIGMAGLGWEDGLSVLSWISCVSFYVVTMLAVSLGLGKHWDQFDMANFASLLRHLTVQSVTYSLAISLGKASLAALYLRIFGDRESRLTILNRGLLLFLLCQAVEETATVTIQCLPAVAQSGSQAEGSCLRLKPLWWASFVCNLITNMLLFIQPLPYLWQPDLRLNDRLTLAIITSIGLLIIIISPIRQTVVSRIGTDTTYDYCLPIIWSEVEAGAVILCSCLPSFRQALQPFWARQSGQTSSTTHSIPLPLKAAPKGLRWRTTGGPPATKRKRSLSVGRKRKTGKDAPQEEFQRITPLDRVAWIDSLAFQAVWLKGGQLGTHSHIEAAPTPTPTHEAGGAAPGRLASWGDATSVGRMIQRWRRGSFDGGLSTQDSAAQPITEGGRGDSAMSGANLGIVVTREFTYAVEPAEDDEDRARASTTRVDDDSSDKDVECEKENEESRDSEALELGSLPNLDRARLKS